MIFYHVDDDDQSPEIIYIKKQAEFLDAADRSGFYDYQIEIVQRKLNALSLNSPKDLTEKVRLLSILDELDELQSLTDTPISNKKDLDSLENKQPEEREENDKRKDNNNTKCSHKRKISFAQQNNTVEFCQHETVLQMKHPKKQGNDSTSKTDEHSTSVNNPQQPSPINDINTLRINVKHSMQSSYCSSNSNKLYEEGSFVPSTPADIYDDYVQNHLKLKTNEPNLSESHNNSIGEKNTRTSILKKSDRNERKSFVETKSEVNEINIKCIIKHGVINFFIGIATKYQI